MGVGLGILGGGLDRLEKLREVGETVISSVMATVVIRPNNGERRKSYRDVVEKSCRSLNVGKV